MFKGKSQMPATHIYLKANAAGAERTRAAALESAEPFLAPSILSQSASQSQKLVALTPPTGNKGACGDLGWVGRRDWAVQYWAAATRLCAYL